MKVQIVLKPEGRHSQLNFRFSRVVGCVKNTAKSNLDDSQFHKLKKQPQNLEPNFLDFKICIITTTASVKYYD